MARQTGIPGGYVNQTATISTGFPGGYVNQTVAAIAVASDTTPEFGYQISSPSLVVYANVVAPQFGYQIQSVALAPTITVTPATFGYQISSPVLASVVNVAPSTYGYQIKSVNLDVHIAPSTYGYQIQSVALSPTINVTPATFAYQIESVPLSQNNAINVTPATFAYQIESVALTPHINVTPATFGYQIESVPLSPIIDVTPATFAYQIESVPLSQNNVIVVKPSTYGFEITDPHLIQQHNLGVQDSTYGYQIESSPLLHFAHSHGSNRHITPQPWYDRKFIAKRNPGLAKIGVKYGLDRIVHVYGSQRNSRVYDVIGTMGKGIQRGKPVAPPIPRNFPITVQSSLYGWMDKPARLIPNLRPSGADYGRKHREVPLVAGFNVGPLTWGWRSNGPRLTQLLILGSTLTSGFTVTSPTLAQTSIVTPNAMTMGREIANVGLQITLKVNSPEFGKTIRSVGVINHVAGTGFKAGFTAGTPSIVQTLRPNQSDYGRQIGSVPVSINLLPNAAQFGFKTGIGATLTQTAGTSKNVFGHQIKSVGLTFTNVLPTSNATFGTEIGNTPLSLNIKPNNATFGKQVGDGSMRSNLRIVSSDYGKEISTAAIRKNIVVTPATFGREITSTGQFPLASPAAMTTGFTTSQVKLIRTLNTTKNVFGFQAGSPSLTVHITDVKSAQFGYQVKSPAIQHNLKLKSFTQGYQISSPSVVHANVPISPFTKGIEMGTARLQLGFVPKPATFGYEIKSVALTHAQQIATTKMDMGHEHTSVYLRGAPVTLAWSSPADGSTLPGTATFTFVGSNFQNVEVFDQTGTFFGRCTINATRTVATLTFNTSALTGTVTYSAHAWNSAPGDGTFTSEADSGLRSFVATVSSTPAMLIGWYRDAGSDPGNPSSWLGRFPDFTINNSFQDATAGGVFFPSSLGGYPVVIDVDIGGAFGNTDAAYASVASGAQDGNINATLASWSPISSIYAVRIDSEFNLHNVVGVVTAAHYIGAFNRVATLAKAMYGSTVKCIFNPNIGNHGDVTPYYPNGADMIGVDCYFEPEFGDDFNSLNIGNLGDLVWFSNLAKAKGVPLCFPEWSDLYPNGSNIIPFVNWMQTNNVVMHCYWDSNDALSIGSGGNNSPVLINQWQANYKSAVPVSPVYASGVFGAAKAIPSRTSNWPFS